MKILLAEDDTASRALLENKLREMGHEVFSAPDGEVAWDRFLGSGCSVVVSDWAMPRLDGVDLCRRIREYRSPGYVYFILQTARTGSEDYLKAMHEGVDDFLPKPVDFQELEIRLQVAGRIIGYKTTIQQLQSLLPICMYCKKVRADREYWQQVESYIRDKIGTNFSHGVCPDCYTQFVTPQLNELAGDAQTG
ncbi:MAG: response regulator transcription factor [Methylacidiphilales bacterium]|nr:response regulator transcription factor [Candidatus Methylacidiphilales bacterium]